MDVDPVKAEEIEIMRLEFQLSSHKMHLATLKVGAAHVNEKTAAAQKTNGIETEREEWFRKKASTMAEAVDKGYTNWENVANKGPFASAKEAKEWVLGRLPEWRQNHEN
jgi:hypothetical protein